MLMLAPAGLESEMPAGNSLNPVTTPKHALKDTQITFKKGGLVLIQLWSCGYWRKLFLVSEQRNTAASPSVSHLNLYERQPRCSHTKTHFNSSKSKNQAKRVTVEFPTVSAKIAAQVTGMAAILIKAQSTELTCQRRSSAKILATKH